MTEDQINEFNQNCIGLSLNVPKPRISKVQRAIFLLKNFTRLKLVVKVDKEETPIINAHGNLHYKNRYDTL
jgi:predicted XRE-type DNA-binding protein